MFQRNNSKNNNSISSSENTSKNEEIILELFSSKIKGKHMELFEEKNIIHENLMLFIVNFLKEKQKIKRNFVFLSQIVLIKLPKISLEFQYIYFANKEKKIEDNMNNYHYFLYILQLNNHWALASINLHSKICVIYSFCKFTKEKMKKIIKTIHQNFMNYKIKSFVFEDFFEKFNEKDDFEVNCSLFLNFFIINFYNDGKIPSKSSVINHKILKENQRKVLKIMKAFIKKNNLNSKDNRLEAILEEIVDEKKNLMFALQKLKKSKVIRQNSLEIKENLKEKNEKIEDEKAEKIEEIGKEKPLKIEQNNEEMASIEQFLEENRGFSFPKITRNISTLSQKLEENKGENFPKITRNITTLGQKREENSMKNHVKNKLIEEIFRKNNMNKRESGIKNLKKFQNNFFDSYFYNPSHYGNLLKEYNTKDFHSLMKSFGMSDKDYEIF